MRKGQKKQTQKGRSMTEMLGVLALIAVLTLTGIVGYRLGITKYKANETLNELQLRAMVLSDQMLKNKNPIDMDELGYVMRMGYPVSARISPKFANFFEIFIQNVEPSVCRELLSRNWQLPYTITVGTNLYKGDTSICGDDNAVQMAYEFKGDLMPGTSIGDDDKHDTDRCNNENDCKCGTCEEGLCTSYCPQNAACVKSFDDPRWLVCCVKDNVVNNMCCAHVTEDGSCCDMSGNCCPKDKPLKDKNGKCYACEEAGNYYVIASWAECAKCPNRVYGFNVNDKCMVPCDTPGTYTEGKPLANIDGICYSCDEKSRILMGSWGDNNRCTSLCPGRVLNNNACYLKTCTVEKPLMDVYNTCNDCFSKTPNLFVGIDASCEEACPNRKQVGEYCVVKECNGFIGPNGMCYDCEEKTAVDLNGVPQNCASCPNRKLANNRYCALPCADGKVMDRTGACYACSYERLFYTTYNDSSECDLCGETRGFFMPDRCFFACDQAGTFTEGKPLTDDGGTCYSCYDERDILINYGDVNRCQTICPNRKMIGNYCVLNECDGFRNTSGSCLKCDDAGNYYTFATPDECAKCPNRIHGFNMNDKCMLPCSMPGTYTEGKPLANIDGICYACNDPRSISMGTWGDKNRCSALCPNRELNGSNCVRKECPDGEFEGSDSVCYPCNITTPIDVNGDAKECAKCLNRKMDGKYCILP